MSIYQEQAEQLVAEYEQRRAKSAELRRKASEIRGTATGSRGAIKVTAGVQGDVTAIEFPTGAYKRMTPKELSDGLLATIGAARAGAMEAFRELMTPEMPAGFLQMLQGSADPAAAAPTEADIPADIRRYLGGGAPAGRGPEPA